MTSEDTPKLGSIDSLAEATGRDARDPSVLADFTHALGQMRQETPVADGRGIEFGGLLLERHLGSSVTTPSDISAEEAWQTIASDPPINL